MTILKAEGGKGAKGYLIVVLMCIPEKTIIPKKIHAPNVDCSTIYHSQEKKQPKYPSTEEWIKKIWYIHTMDYHSAIKNKSMPFADKRNISEYYKQPYRPTFDKWIMKNKNKNLKNFEVLFEKF